MTAAGVAGEIQNLLREKRTRARAEALLQPRPDSQASGIDSALGATAAAAAEASVATPGVVLVKPGSSLRQRRLQPAPSCSKSDSGQTATDPADGAASSNDAAERPPGEGLGPNQRLHVRCDVCSAISFISSP